jgi:L-lactate dehydrogenase complex protein LldG
MIRPSEPLAQVGVAAVAERFLAEANKVGAFAERVASQEQARYVIVDLAREYQVRTALRTDSPFFDDLLVDASLAAQGMEVFIAGEIAPLSERAQAADLGITEADFALADTGTLVIRSRPGQPRTVSLLPPTLIAVVPVSRVVADLAHLFAVLDMKEATRGSSGITFITGPSRTADIEQTLVIGVHGPARLHIILID